ncbi:uncharacterized protein LOC132045703 [Lycium ferocissimum]|uniref:uncharacterized protein LOC132045703 n=1 Tax=Lycium ferocissimum TaxID=112874 RepID=UPI0028158D54|nr:uncharacterized protein LOC132045703 [Lycium ferocissimum]
MVAEMEDRVYRFMVGLGPHLIDKCTTAALQPGMDISRIQAYAQNMEDRKRQWSAEWSSPLGFSGPRFDRPSYSRAGQNSRASDACYACGRPGHVMKECSSRGSVDIVQPIGSIASSSSSIHPPKQGSQLLAGRGRGRSRALSSSSLQNRIYALAGRQDHELSPDVATGTFPHLGLDDFCIGGIRC